MAPKPCTRRLRAFATRQLATAGLFLAGVCWLPYWWCSRPANSWLTDDAALQSRLANGVAHWMSADLDRAAFQTGSSQFDGEWLFGTYLMAGLGFGQSALRHPEFREPNILLMERCIDAIQSDAVRAFDRESWNTDPLATLDGPEDHAAYLGYLNLLLGFYRQVNPDSPYNPLNDRISTALARRIAASPSHLLETYPGETYPVDNCAVFASVALHAQLTGTDRAALFADWRESFRRHSIDPPSGLLVQAVDKTSGAPLDAPRGSGTTLGLYFLSFADPALSRELYEATHAQLFRRVFGFGGVREYPNHVPRGRGDIDSGPVIFGFGLSPTGFLIAGSRIHRDPAVFQALYATAHAWGAPLHHGERLNFVTGASLGDAILFAMLTAQPATPIDAPHATAPAPHP